MSLKVIFSLWIVLKKRKWSIILSPMGLMLACCAGFFVALTNFCIRRGIDIGGNAKAFFVCQMSSSALFSFLAGPVQKGDFAIALSPMLLGLLAGLFLGGMLFSLGRAVESGPPGFTFAILNSATVMPGLLMALLFGAAHGFLYTYWHAIGSLLLLLGLFWGVKGMQGIKDRKNWFLFASLMFLFHILLLALYQYRAMLMKCPDCTQFGSEWFSSLMFFTCGCIQLVIYLRLKKRPRRGEILYGLGGGLSNCLCTVALLIAAERATSLENAIIFPTFSVVGIILTNLWSQKLYFERVNWKACYLSALGLLLAAIN